MRGSPCRAFLLYLRLVLIVRETIALQSEKLNTKKAFTLNDVEAFAFGHSETMKRYATILDRNIVSEIDLWWRRSLQCLGNQQLFHMFWFSLWPLETYRLTDVTAFSNEDRDMAVSYIYPSNFPYQHLWPIERKARSKVENNRWCIHASSLNIPKKAFQFHFFVDTLPYCELQISVNSFK